MDNAEIVCDSGAVANWDEVCQFICDAGYRGDTTVTCQRDGDRDADGGFGTLPSCSGKSLRLEILRLIWNRMDTSWKSRVKSVLVLADFTRNR